MALLILETWPEEWHEDVYSIIKINVFDVGLNVFDIKLNVETRMEPEPLFIFP